MHLTMSSNFVRAYKKAFRRLTLLTTEQGNLTTETAKLIFKMMIPSIKIQLDNKNNVYSNVVK